MISKLFFESDREYHARLSEANFWRPLVNEIAARHGLGLTESKLQVGVGGTYPTFLLDGFVIKLFGYIGSWRKTYASEITAYELLSLDPAILSPQLICEGRLFNSSDTPWPYIVTTRTLGLSWNETNLPFAKKMHLATQLGAQIHRIHRLPATGFPSDLDWPALNIKQASQRSSLPPHLTAQVDDYIAKLGPFDRVFVHGDLFPRHVFVQDGELSGIIDWGDAVVTDRHYELAKLHLDTFNCDKTLLRAFLNASDWPIEKDFAVKSLGLALMRQATGLMQHLTNDTFYKLPSILPLHSIRSLEQLAEELFGI